MYSKYNYKSKLQKNKGIFIIFIVIVFSLCSCTKKDYLQINKSFFLINALHSEYEVVVSSAINTVYINGGANYLFSYKGENYLSLACYDDEKQAKVVACSLKLGDINVEVLKVEIEKFEFNEKDKDRLSIIEKNLYFYIDLISTLGDIALKLDSGDYTQERAKKEIVQLNKEVKKLYSQNTKEKLTSSRYSNFDSLNSSTILKLQKIVSNIVLSSQIRNLQLNVLKNITAICQ